MTPRRIALLGPAPVPAVEGGAERLLRSLATALRERGHEVDVITVPFPENDLAEVVAGYRAFRDLDVSSYDVVVSGKYPSWAVEHPRHLRYLLHPLRGLYDTYPAHLDPEAESVVRRRLELADESGLDAVLAEAEAIVAGLDGDAVALALPTPLSRTVVHALDRAALRGVHHHAAIAEEVAARRDYQPDGVPVQVVHPVSDLPIAAPAPAEPGLVFTASRHDGPKRLDLIIRAFARVGHPDARLVIAGDGPRNAELRELARGDARVEFVGRVDEAGLADWYTRASLVVFTPDHEDYGYITAEAMASGTAVLTTTDAGGPTELVEDDVNGAVVEPDEAQLALAMDGLLSDPQRLWRLGQAGRRRAAEIHWDPLLESIERLAAPEPRPKAVVLSTFPMAPTIGGGQRRVRAVARGLATTFDVTIASLDETDTIHHRVLEPGIAQLRVPRSASHRAADAAMTALAEVPVDDIGCTRLWEASPLWRRTIEPLCAEADVIVCSHPFLAPSLPDVAAPVVYDCHNVEHHFKATLLGGRRGADWFVAQTERAERDLTGRAAVVTACTPADVEELLALGAGEKPTVIANGVDVAELPLRTDADRRACRAELLAHVNVPVSDERPIALFMGSWHGPNIEAGKVVVTTARSRPDWLFVLAGGFSTSLPRPLPSNVATLGMFPDALRPTLLAGADVALNPMRSGGGSNLKMADYLALGVPVIASPLGARGLPDPDALVALAEATPTGLSAALDGFDPDTDVTRARITAGRAWVEAEADWPRLGADFARAVLSGLDRPVPDDLRPRTERPRPLAPTLPPPDGARPVEHLFRTIADRAVADRFSSGAVAGTDPTRLRAAVDQARRFRHLGRVLPEKARLRGPKRVLIRLGQSITNEQLHYNEAVIDALDGLVAGREADRRTIEALEARIVGLEARLAEAQGTSTEGRTS